MEFTRYAIYFTANETPLARFGAKWLGWDNITGRFCEANQNEQDGTRGQNTVVTSPHRYGFHATIMAPFELDDHASFEDMVGQFRESCAQGHRSTIEHLRLGRLGRFLALVAAEDTPEIKDMAAIVVKAMNGLRAGQTDVEKFRRTPRNATLRQKDLVDRYGYCRVMEEFAFHMTLTSRLKGLEFTEVEQYLKKALPQVLTDPFDVSSLSLMGEDRRGYFHVIETRALGQAAR